MAFGGDSRLDKRAWMTQSHFQMCFKGLQWNLSVRFTGPDVDCTKCRLTNQRRNIDPCAHQLRVSLQALDHLCPSTDSRAFVGEKALGLGYFVVSS